MQLGVGPTPFLCPLSALPPPPSLLPTLVLAEVLQQRLALVLVLLLLLALPRPFL